MFRCCSLNRYAKLTVIGGGTMGGGIAQVAASAGVPVSILGTSDARIARSRKTVETSLGRVAKKKCDGDEAKMKEFVGNIMKNITWTTDAAAAVDGTGIVIEAAVEKADLKKELFAKLDKLAPKEAVFCTNTSSLSVADLATSTSRPERFVGTHFFSPVPMMKLVEVVKTEKSDPKVIEEVCAFSKKLGKVPVVAADTEGFIVNRLFVPYLFESYRLVERGVASMEDVDTAMKLGCGYPMGPFELSDNLGLDVLKLIIDGWHEAFPNDKLFEPVKSLDELVAKGHFGKKTGAGFYKYDDKGRRVA